ncbi:glycosyltransferase [Legionella sp. MW5194]|uniref:glycosyltransferase family 2 protein n=1 Tax=Legionella sp. MW5194 TaxID=2662448 RepID=UPI001EEF91FC|nr:glycosyltransferase [Legionella sp. MW5194]
MNDFLYGLAYYFTSLFSMGNIKSFLFIFFPFVFLLELPFYVLTILYSIRGWINLHFKGEFARGYYPIVTIVITAYNETYEEILTTMRAVGEQIYPGKIETMIIVDNAVKNIKTAQYAKQLAAQFGKLPNRFFTVIERQTRGGHASSMNLGLKLAKGEVLIMLDADTSIDNQTVAKAAAHFIDPNVIAVSGAVRVRNYKDSILTRLQAIEYMIGIQLGRFGLTELNVTNNISGAFGVFRTGFLKQIGGWLNGTAEDLDLTLRLHVYVSRYTHLKIVHEPFAIAWTAAPVKLKTLLKQRLRWDGDLYYIYVRRHWRKFSPALMNRMKMFFFSWYGLYYQLVLPFIVLLYSILLFLQYSLTVVVAVNILVYCYYLLTGLLMYVLFLLLVSERPRQDAKMIGWVLLMPIYQQFMRYMATIFILNEIIFKGHKDSSMAPWWVIKRTK